MLGARFGVLFVLSAAFGLAACRHDSAAQPQPPGPTLQIGDGVFVMRLVMDLEGRVGAGHVPAEYLPLSGIAAVSGQTWLKQKVTLIDDENGSYKGYALRVTAQGSRYEASLVPTRGCGTAFFVDDRILIYTAHGLGCGAAPRPAVAAPTLGVEEGVNVMRRLIDVEVNAYRAGFRPLADLLSAPDPESPRLKSDMTLTDNENGSFKDYDVRVTAQNARFEASLVPSRRGCGLAFFIDERAVIYTGDGLGCPERR